MSSRKPSRIRWFFGFVLFRIVPALLVVAILWTGWGVLQQVLRRINEQAEYEQRRPTYALTATAISLTLPTRDADRSAQRGAGRILAQPITDDMATVIAQFVTNTPANAAAPDIAFATNTPAAPSQSDTAEASPTPAPAFEMEISTPRPLPTVLFLGDPDPNQVDVTAIPTRVQPIDRQGYDLMNILLLGTDEELSNDGFRRTDTMIILSINRDTGSVAMLSLPRDLFVYIPAWGMQRLNLAWARGDNGGWVDGPFVLIRHASLF